MNPSGFALSDKRIFVAGHRGMLGSAIVRRLAAENCEVLAVGRAQLDLRRQAEVDDWMAANMPRVVVLAAATVGGILANSTRPAEFLYDNLLIEANIIQAARHVGVEKLLLLGSSCIYPKAASQPISEEALLTGPLEPTNEWYAIAKIAGVKLCQAYRRQYGCDFITAMPTNLYGPGDNFDLASGHVIAALMRKIDHAHATGCKSVEIWGSGLPRREFLHVDDAADACIFLLKHYSAGEPVNVGLGRDIMIRDLAHEIAEVVGFRGEFAYDNTKPDGTPQKLLNIDRLNALGWRATIGLREGLEQTYRWYRDHCHRTAA